MRPPLRWPLHPAPFEGEALSSWLYRVAYCYQMDLPDLLQHDLAHNLDAQDLDTKPPIALLETLTLRSGISLDQLRSMSFVGWTPWLLDSLDLDTSAFDTYVRQLSVLLPLHKRKIRNVQNGWCAWLPKQAIHRACPQCVNSYGKHVLLLMWQLPLMLSCPQHGCWLEPYLGVNGQFLRWETEDPLLRQASEPIAMMDYHTSQALTTGHVELPRRRIHAGMWFRLLRTLLDELNIPLSHCGSQAQDIRGVWEHCGYPVRAGLYYWHSYETLPSSAQLQMLEAAATTIQLIETGSLTAFGADAKLFLPEPVRKIPDGRPTERYSKKISPWQEMMIALDESVAEAKRNPEAAQSLFKLVLFGRTDAKSIREVQANFIDLDIPLEFLSQNIEK